jgi:hypothetical protein
VSTLETLWVWLLILGIVVTFGGSMTAIVLAFLERYETIDQVLLVALAGFVLMMFIGISGSLMFGGGA